MRNLRAQVNSGWATAFGALLTCLTASVFASADLPAEDADDWSLSKETDNIRVYTAEQGDSSIRAFKAEAVMDAPIENLMAVMVDPESCVEWVHNCSDSSAFGDGDFHDRYAYSVNDMPWPVADRDYVLRIRTRGDQASGEIVMDLNAIPDRRDKVDGHVRVDRSDTLYRFIPAGEKTRMIWVQHTDPNGSIPSWLVNSLLVDIPVRSMEQLERVTRKERYQGFSLVYDDDGQLTGVEPPSQSGDD